MSPAEWKYVPTPGVEQFSTTCWNVVLLAGEDASPRAAQALEQLSRTYWFPLYAYLRRLSYGPQDAQNLTEIFFGRLVGRSASVSTAGQKGKFRGFLLASLNHFLAYERDGTTEGGQATISIEGREAECRYLQDALSELSPERMFERRWAIIVLERALSRLRDEHATAGNARQFAVLRKFLTSSTGDKAYGRAAEELNMSAGSVAGTLQRMQQRYRELVRAEIADTVAGTGDIDDETRWLVGALS